MFSSMDFVTAKVAIRCVVVVINQITSYMKRPMKNYEQTGKRRDFCKKINLLCDCKSYINVCIFISKVAKKDINFMCVCRK